MAPSPAHVSRAAGKRRILIVDDEEGMRELLKAILESDYQVAEADSGAALQKALDGEQPDVVLLDMKLPDANGLGLAAQQIDETQALCVVDVPAGMDMLVEDGPRLNPAIAMPLVMFNPEIIARAGNEALTDEGCLSFPKLYAPVSRVGVVTVRFLNLRGQVQTCEVRGLLARAVQHELDHLAGVLFVDHVASAEREALDAQLQEMERTGRRQTGQ